MSYYKIINQLKPIPSPITMTLGNWKAFADVLIINIGYQKETPLGQAQKHLFVQILIKVMKKIQEANEKRTPSSSNRKINLSPAEASMLEYGIIQDGIRLSDGEIREWQGNIIQEIYSQLHVSKVNNQLTA